MDPLEQDSTHYDHGVTSASNPVLLWWAEAVDLLARLPPHQRVQILARIDKDIHRTLAPELPVGIYGPWRTMEGSGLELVPIGECEGLDGEMVTAAVWVGGIREF